MTTYTLEMPKTLEACIISRNMYSFRMLFVSMLFMHIKLMILKSITKFRTDFTVVFNR